MEPRIKKIMKEKRVTQVALAEKLGVHPVTLSKKLSPDSRGKMDIEWIEKIAAALEVTPQELLFRHAEARTVTVKSFVQAGNWSDNHEWDEDDWYDVAVPADAALNGFNLYAAETRGPSMNKRYPEGTALVFTDIIETQEDIQPGKRYHVERERADGLREATVKLLWRDENGHLWLLPESDDPRHQEPIELNGAEGDTIRIVGRVRYSVTRE